MVTDVLLVTAAAATVLDSLLEVMEVVLKLVRKDVAKKKEGRR